MKYVGEIHKLYIQMSAKGLSKEEIVDKIFEFINKDREITKEEIEQALNNRLGI